MLSRPRYAIHATLAVKISTIYQFGVFGNTDFQDLLELADISAARNNRYIEDQRTRNRPRAQRKLVYFVEIPARKRFNSPTIKPKLTETVQSEINVMYQPVVPMRSVIIAGLVKKTLADMVRAASQVASWGPNFPSVFIAFHLFPHRSICARASRPASC